MQWRVNDEKTGGLRCVRRISAGREIENRDKNIAAGPNGTYPRKLIKYRQWLRARRESSEARLISMPEIDMSPWSHSRYQYAALTFLSPNLFTSVNREIAISMKEILTLESWKMKYIVKYNYACNAAPQHPIISMEAGSESGPRRWREM